MSAHQATEQENILQAEKGQNRKAIHTKNKHVLCLRQNQLVQKENAFDGIYTQKGKEGTNVKRTTDFSTLFNEAGCMIQLILCYAFLKPLGH